MYGKVAITTHSLRIAAQRWCAAIECTCLIYVNNGNNFAFFQHLRDSSQILRYFLSGIIRIECMAAQVIFKIINLDII